MSVTVNFPLLRATGAEEPVARRQSGFLVNIPLFGQAGQTENSSSQTTSSGGEAKKREAANKQQAEALKIVAAAVSAANPILALKMASLPKKYQSKLLDEFDTDEEQGKLIEVLSAIDDAREEPPKPGDDAIQRTAQVVGADAGLATAARSAISAQDAASIAAAWVAYFDSETLKKAAVAGAQALLDFFPRDIADLEDEIRKVGRDVQKNNNAITRLNRRIKKVEEKIEAGDDTGGGDG